MTNRRGFLKSGALAVFGMGLNTLPNYVLQAAAAFRKAELGAKSKILIVIFQRGAMDGLMAVSPFNDLYLKKVRPNLHMSPGNNKESLYNLNDRFGLHPGFSALIPMFQKNELAIIHGVGSPNVSRSHFDAQDYMESGTPFQKSTDSGWLNRTSGLIKNSSSPFKTVSLTRSMPRSFYGDNPTLSLSNLSELNLKSPQGLNASMATAQSFEALYDQTTSDILKANSKETFEAMDMVSKINTKTYTPQNGASYPKSDLGQSLLQIAQLIRSDVGLEIGFAESNGWDTHFNQGTSNGVFMRNASDLGNSMAAFWQDMGEEWQERIVVMTMTEFGRTVRQNGTGGTDHGRASCYFLLGKNINGGKVHGKMETLSEASLEDGRDLAVTTDFRAVFSEVVQKQFSLSPNNLIFPGWKGDSLGLMKG